MSTENFQFSTSSPANSLPDYGTLLRQNMSSLGPEKKRVSIFFGIFFLSEFICTYNKLYKYGKKKFHVLGTSTHSFSI